MVVEPAMKVALAVRVALTMDGLDGDVAQLAAEAAPGGNPIANMPALVDPKMVTYVDQPAKVSI
jgi:phosphatidylserine synthase